MKSKSTGLKYNYLHDVKEAIKKTPPTLSPSNIPPKKHKANEPKKKTKYQELASHYIDRNSNAEQKVVRIGALARTRLQTRRQSGKQASRPRPRQRRLVH